jgi:hypothetical protein
MNDDAQRRDDGPRSSSTNAAGDSNGARLALNTLDRDVERPAGVHGIIAWDRQWRRWWHRRLPFLMRSLPWPAIVATLAGVVMLVVFQSVVRGVVQQADSRRMIAATHADAIWRCKTMPGRRARDDCLAQVMAAPSDAATLQTRDTTLAPVTQASR